MATSWAPGEWTDDISMALALADSLASAGWNLNDQLDRYVNWWKVGKYSVNDDCFDSGIATKAALSRFIEHSDERRSGNTEEHSSGNGSIMRLAPLSIRYAGLFPGSIGELSRLAAESSLTTHASEQRMSAGRYMTLVLAGLLQGIDRDVVLAPDWQPLAQLATLAPLHPAIAEVAGGSFRPKQPPEIKGSGWVVQSLEAALWAFHQAESFEDAVLRAVNLGNDADMTGAVCGQFAGAYWGESGVPQRWRDGLARRDMIETALNEITE